MNNTPDDFIRGRLQQQLTQADTLIQNERFDDALNVIQYAYEIAGNFPELRQTVAQKEASINDIRQSRINALLATAQGMVADPNTFDEGTIGSLLDQVQALDSNNHTARTLRTEVADLAPQLRERRVYEQARQQCARLWDQEQEYIQANVPTNEILSTIFRKAVEIAEQTQAQYPESVRLLGLKAEAQRLYNTARTRYEVKSTADETGDYKAMIDELQKERDLGKLIPWQDATGQMLEPITVAEALQQAERLAGDYAYRKANEYLQQAQQHMAAHAPRAAKEIVEKQHDLFQLDDEMKARLAHYLNNTVAPELRQLEEAERVLHFAQTADDPGRGWNHIEEALKQYNWIPSANDVRRALLPRLADQANRLLQTAQRHLKNNQIADATPSAQKALTYAERIVTHADQPQLRQRGQTTADQARQLVAQCQAEEQLMHTLVEAGETIKNLLKNSPGAAIRRWEELVREHGQDTIDRFPMTRSLQSEVETHSGITSLLTRLDSTFTSNDPGRLTTALQDIEKALAEPTYIDFKNDLLHTQEKIQLRLDYQAGLSLYNDSNDPQSALPFLDRVARKTNHPDSPPAGQLASQIRSNKALAQRADQNLKDARALLADKPQQAYKLLAPLLNTPTLRKREIQEQLTLARDAWQQNLIARVEKELARDNIRPGRLRQLISEIHHELPEPRPITLAERASAHASATEATLHETANEWQQAATKWQEALTHDRLNPNYKQHWKNARKHVAEIQLDRIQGDEEARGLFDDLEQEIPLDPEVREWRTRYYVRRAESQGIPTTQQINYYATARTALQSTQEALARPGTTTDEKLRGRIRDLEETIINGEQLSRTRANIERKLRPNGSLAEFDQARQEAHTLLTDNRNNITLQDWWQRTRSHIIETLVNNDSNLPGEDHWAQFDLRSKILALNPDHALAQQLLRDLPNLATDISQAITNLLNDRRMGLLISVNNDLAVLETQERTATIQLEQARAIYDMFNGFKDHINDPTVTSLLSIIRADLENLQGFLTELSTLSQLKAQSISYLSQAKIDGEWRNFERTIKEFNETGYNNHRTVEALRQQRNTTQRRRTELLDLRNAIITAVAHEKFTEAQNHMRRFETDDQMGDPHDEYGLRATFQMADPLTGESLANWRQAKNWLRQRQEQITTLQTWLIESGAMHLALQFSLPIAPPPAGTPRATITWNQINQTVRAKVNAGRFGEARNQTQRMLEGQDNWYDKRDQLLALVPAARHLAIPPIQPDQALSTLARDLLQAAQDYRESTLLNEIQRGKNTITWIARQRQEWRASYPTLQQAFAELDSLYNKGWLWRRRNQSAQEAAVARLQAALIKCKAIAPNHPSLQGIEDHPLLQ